MEIIAALLTSLDPTATADNGTPGKGSEQSPGVAALLFSALLSFHFNDVSVQAGGSAESAPVEGSEGHVTESILAPAQEDKSIENDPAGGPLLGSAVSEEKRWAPSPQAARPQSAAASEEIEAGAGNPQVGARPPESYGSEPAAMAPAENSKIASRDPATIDQNAEQMMPASVEQPAEAKTEGLGATAGVEYVPLRDHGNGAASPPLNVELPEAAILSKEVLSAPPDAAREEQRSTRPNDALAPSPSQQAQSVSRGQVSTAEKNLGQMVSAIARDHGDEVTPGFKLGHEPQMATDGPKATLEPPRSSSVQPVDSQSGERHFRNGDGHDRPVARRPQETPLEALRDSPALAGAPMPRGYEIQQDSAPLSKWRPTVERLADDIVSHARLGRTEAVLQLDPPELGKIKIALRLEDGKLQARIIAEGHDSKQLLEAHLPELRQALAAGRLDVIDVRVSQGNGSGLSGDLSQSFQRSPQGQQGSDRNSFHPLPPTPPEPPPGQRRTGREAGRVSMWA